MSGVGLGHELEIAPEEGVDALISTPGRHANSHYTRTANALSPDGRLLVVGHIESSQADLIDLRRIDTVQAIGFAADVERIGVFAASRHGRKQNEGNEHTGAEHWIGRYPLCRNATPTC